MLMSMAHSIIKSGSRLSLLTMGSRILGLVREMTKAAFLGTSALSDAFTIAFFIPNLLRRLFAENSISVAFIPTFRQYLDNESPQKIKEFLSATFTVIALATSLTVVAGIIGAPLIIPFFGTGTDETVLLTRIMFPYLAIISLAAFFQGILNGIRVFSPTGFTPILFNLVIIGSTWLFSSFTGNPARAMAIGVLLGGTVQAAFQLPFVLKAGFRFKPVNPLVALSDPGTKTVLHLIGPTVIGMAAYQINDLVSSILASNAGTGIVSSLQYSLRLQELILGVFAVSIGTVILPDLSSHAAKEQWDLFTRLLSRAMNIIAFITIPVTFFSLVFGQSLITLLFKTRSFSDDSVALTLNAFTFHVMGLYCIALNRIISPAFYAKKDTKRPTIAGLFSFCANIILALILVGPMRGGGIALALSLASAVNTACLLYFLGKTKTVELGPFLRNTASYAGKITLFSAVSACPLWYFKEYLLTPFANLGRIAGNAIPITLGFGVFLLIFVLQLCMTKDPVLTSLRERLSGTKRSDY